MDHVIYGFPEMSGINGGYKKTGPNWTENGDSIRAYGVFYVECFRSRIVRHKRDRTWPIIPVSNTHVNPALPCRQCVDIVMGRFGGDCRNRMRTD